MQPPGRVGTGEAERVHTPFVARPAEVLGAELERLQIGAHGAVEHQHALPQLGEIVTAPRGDHGVRP